MNLALEGYASRYFACDTDRGSSPTAVYFLGDMNGPQP